MRAPRVVRDALPMMLATRLALVFALTLAPPTQASELGKRAGWEVMESPKPYDLLLRDLLAAVKSEGLIVVTQAGPTKAAAARGITIPGNRVVGVFNNDYAVRILALSTAAMIEAPIRFYVTEDARGGSHLSYKRPSHVFAPYFGEGGSLLLKISKDLDQRFAAITAAALR
ncbi:DUF302 domain-containing protein [Pseudophaeobacter sp.]|uniref:DUF302 domain-containing protein n=1 Tax=Pseudophaeobacter sp. TaxID=1971739 RepID=UPI00329A29A2